MAILFDDASGESMDGTPPVTAAAFTMGCWFNSDTVAQNQHLMYIGNSANDTNSWSLEASGAIASDPVRAFASTAAGSVSASTSAGYTANTWYHACMVEAGATSRAVFLNGGSKGTNATSRQPASADRLAIGRFGGATPGSYMSGLICEAFVYNVALADADVALLGMGFSPLLVHPESLVFYLPMISLGSTTQTDWVGGRVMTENNTPVTGAHFPNIVYPAWLTNGYGIATLAGALSGSLRLTGMMSAIPLAANYGIYASDVPKRTFVSR